MDAARRGYVGFAILIAVMAVIVWADSVPALRVPFGVAMMALAILTWVRPIVRPRPPGTPNLPLSLRIGLSIGLLLVGVSKLWPPHDFTTLAVLCIFVPQVTRMVREYRGTDDQSVSEQ